MLTPDSTPLAQALTEGGKDRRNVALALAKAGGHVLFVDPSSKAPLDLRSDPQRRKDDAAERERTGDPSATAPTGLHLATDDEVLIGRYWARAERDRVEPNLALRLGRSGLVAVDADTAEQVAAVQELAGAEPLASFPLTTSSPGARNTAGEWVHRDGGHFLFTTDEDTPAFGKIALPGGAVVMSGDSYVLVPPSVRPEGPYVNVGPVHPLSSAPWLVERIRAHADTVATAHEERRSRAAARAERREAGDDVLGRSIAEWNDARSWASLLEPDGWEENRTGRNGQRLSRQRMDSCGCPTWTAPGDHANSKSATTHEYGCTSPQVELEGSSGPLMFWTTTRPPGLGDRHRSRWTKAQYFTDTKHGGDLSEFAKAEGIAPSEPLLDPSEFVLATSGTLGGTRGPHDPALLADVFGYSPVTAHILEQARARMVGPWSALLVALVHATVLTPWQVRLPALVGGEASTNMIVALVGGSGAGKGVSTSSSPILRWASDPLDAHPALGGTVQDTEAALSPRTPGSGEAIATLFRDWRTIETADDKGKVTRTLKLVTVGRTAWMDFPEVDQVAALMRRESSTLSAELRKVWDGRQLGVHTKSKERRSEVAAFTYRAAVTIGVQPERAEGLLSGEDGGLPQRIVWAATDDPGLGDEDDTALASYDVDPPPWQLDGDRIVWMGVADTIRVEIRRDRRRVLRKEPGALVGIDAHRNLVRLKLAAAVAVLHSRTEVTEDDWRLAGQILTHSDRVREDVRRTLATAVAASHEARGAADTARERGARRTRDDEVDKAATSVHEWLANRKGRAFTASQIRAASKTGSARHTWCAEALAVLTDEGSVGPEGVSRTGTTAYTWTSDREGPS